MNPAPVLRVRGRVHRAPFLNPVESSPAREAVVDEATGRTLQPARPAREGYDKYDTTILTEAGGFVTVVSMLPAVEQAGGYLPEADEVVDLPVRAYVAWRQGQRGWYPVAGFSFAGDVYAAEHKLHEQHGARVAAVS